MKGNGVKTRSGDPAADLQADLSQLASHFGGLKASLASPAEVDALTACVFGAIPPFSFHPDLALVADPLLFERVDEIAFNAGLLEKSVIMDTRITCASPVLSWWRSTEPDRAGWRSCQPFLSRSSTEATRITAMAKNDEEIISVSTNM